jgi:hypothetical protein
MVTRRSRRGRLLAALVCVFLLVFVVAARAALVGLPSDGSQVNNDPGAGIDPSKDISGDNPAADVVGGSLAAGGVNVPWAIFRQTTTGADQIFVRSFKGGAWTTQGKGTVGGRSSASPSFSASLNFDQAQEGEAPEIDFAGGGRNVPWTTWYENTTGTGFEMNNVFASRFDAASGNWIFAGQGRGNGGSGPPVPSLNLHTNQDAENPSVAGGSAVDATKPGPWVTWQETANDNGKDQIFVERPLGPGQANCDGVKPLGVNDGTGHVPAIGGFCWQQTGIPRAGTGKSDPSLNVDPTRDGIEPDIAFTGVQNGVQDGVPWVVWYEQNPTGTTNPDKLRDNELVFAAKGIADGVGANGGFHWVTVGNSASGTLDATGTRGFGSCAADPTVEGNCSLNSNPGVDAEDPRVAAGTMNPANATVPWVVWDEEVGAQSEIFVSRLVGGTNFVIANGAQPISSGGGNATRPDITFSGNTPYISWRQTFGAGNTRMFVGHLVDAANPTFVPDTPNGVPVLDDDIRAPVSSGCIATPFNDDGKSCSGGAIGTPFFLVRDPARLFGNAYQPSGVTTGGASGVGQSTATVSGSVNPEGAAVKAHFDFGTTTGYGSSTPDQVVGVANTPQGFTAGLGGLAAGTTIHYRAVVITDFGTQFGADQTLTTSAAGGGGGGGTTTPPPGPVIPVAAVDRTPPTVKLKLRRISLKRLLKTRKLPVTVTADEASTDKIKVTTRIAAKKTKGKRRRRARTVTVASGTVSFTAAGTKTVTLSLTGGGARALKHRHSARLTFKISATDTSGNTRTTTTAASVR